MTQAQLDEITGAFRQRAEATATIERLAPVLLDSLPDDGTSYAVTGTPYYVSRSGGKLSVKSQPQPPTLAELVKS